MTDKQKELMERAMRASDNAEKVVDLLADEGEIRKLCDQVDTLAAREVGEFKVDMGVKNASGDSQFSVGMTVAAEICVRLLVECHRRGIRGVPMDRRPETIALAAFLLPATTSRQVKRELFDMLSEEAKRLPR